MLDTINGLPVHPLVVHAVVVLLPLAVLGTLAVAAVPRWRARYAGLNALVAVVGAVLCPVATRSGEALERRVGDPGVHAELGDQLLWFAAPLALLAVALWWLQRRQSQVAGSRRPRAMIAAMVLAVVAALATGVQVYRVGDSGAKAVWQDQMTSSAPASGDQGNSD
ncbi:hypothetical protein SAMN06264364_11837 [Quadrisphaera granulorum]|uniref:DUF2231 domain-containing protein n=1 Tax=Quadrisphaera granulorum TaxID=317664 RepID=A0A316A3W0_9ACTN|nr:DUF2231 domain-containing protein [Quadrisphaera granulorum]PWJ52666.1 hypothetical protein BXY45_11837 [Quadrisphaera granulorum]SZE97488.1 hypothetical protein SAMN06264364_11837 [Quadrisphaera granulorum]